MEPHFFQIHLLKIELQLNKCYVVLLSTKADVSQCQSLKLQISLKKGHKKESLSFKMQSYNLKRLIFLCSVSLKKYKISKKTSCSLCIRVL